MQRRHHRGSAHNRQTVRSHWQKGRFIGAVFACALALGACAGSTTETTIVEEDPTTTQPAQTAQGSEPDTTTTTATTMAESTTTTIAESAAFDAVQAAFAAFNAGDENTWVEWREPQEDAAAFDYMIAAGSQIEVGECTSRGYGEWLMDDLMTGYAIDCSVTQTDQLLKPAGIVLEMVYEWVIGTGPETSQGGSNENWLFVLGYFAEFEAWLEQNHPDIAEGMEYESDTGYPTAENVTVALDYIEEFIAQSDKYPVADPIPPLD